MIVLLVRFAIVIFLSQIHCSHAQARKELEIEFKPYFGKEVVKLNSGKYITAKGDSVQINACKFYISNIVLNYESGLKFTEAYSYHLIDIEEPGSGIFLLKNAADDKIKSIAFTIGVDSLACVSGALSGDLDPLKGMYWAWNSGYINAKLEGTSKSCTSNNNKFEFHIGGYMPPNKSSVKAELGLSDSKTKGRRIVIGYDLSVWLKNIDLKKMPSVLIPGKNAVEIANEYRQMFFLSE